MPRVQLVSAMKADNEKQEADAEAETESGAGTSTISLFRLITNARLHTILALRNIITNSKSFDFITSCNYPMLF